MKNSIFAPYIRAKRPPHISQPTDDPRSGFIWCLVTPQGYSRFSKKFSKNFQNFASYGHNRRKTDFFESLKNQRVIKKFENFFLPCLTTYMEPPKKKKNFMGTKKFLEIFCVRNFVIFCMPITRPKNGRKKFHSPNFFQNLSTFKMPHSGLFELPQLEQKLRRKRGSLNPNRSFY